MTHHQLDTVIHAAIFLALLTTAGICALPGWLLPLRDGVTRFTWRYISCGALATAFIWIMFDRAWYWAIFNLLLSAHLIGRTRHWWQRVEQIRKVKRELGIVKISPRLEAYLAKSYTKKRP